jgi:predicted NAD/FAD-binding protein
VIGGGIAGLTAAYLLNKRHEVTLFEKSGRLGGNAYTHVTPDGEAPDIAVAAFGQAGYKNFYALLRELGIETRPCYSYMSFHDLDTKDGLYITPSIHKVLAQGLRLFKPGHLRDLAHLFIGLQKAQRLMDSGSLDEMTMAECLQKISAIRGDARVVFLCALCLLSSMDYAEVLKAPAVFFFDKLRVHHDVLSPKALYSVRCVKNGTRSYVNALAAGLRKKIIFNARIQTVLRATDRVELVTENSRRRAFDKVVFACNADQALKLLAAPTKRERELLGAWRYKDGRVVVHRDYSHFPPRKLIESYTFLYTNRGGDLRISVNGALWNEPHVSKDCAYISSQHPNFPIRRDLTDLDTVLRTPIFDFTSCEAIGRLPALNNVANTFYCGSYFGYGLHEDAVSSAMAVARYFR